MEYAIRFKNKNDDIETEVVAKRLKSVPHDVFMTMAFLCTLNEALESGFVDGAGIVDIVKAMSEMNHQERNFLISQTFCLFREAGFLDEFFKDKGEENDDD